jgi:hypothetical protein
MAQRRLAVQLPEQVVARLRELVELRDEGEHHRQRPARRRPDQRLQLHPHHARLVEAHADRAPAQRRVRLFLGFM